MRHSIFYYEGIPEEKSCKGMTPYCAFAVGTTTAILGGILGGSNILGGLLGSNAAGDAADAQIRAVTDAAKLQYEANKEALALQREQWLKSQENLAPWLQSGQAGLNQLLQGLGIGSLQESDSTYTPADPYAQERASYQQKIADLEQQIAGIRGNSLHDNMLKTSLGAVLDAMQRAYAGLPDAPGAITTKGYEVVPGDPSSTGYGDLMRSFTNADFVKDPGYDFRMGEGIDALEQTAAAKGMPFGGSAAKAAIQYGQNFASNEYMNAYNRFNQDQANRYNRLASLAGIGQTTAQQLGTQGQNYAQNASNTIMNGASMLGDYLTQAGNARASGYVGSANAWGNTLNNFGALLPSIFG